MKNLIEQPLRLGDTERINKAGFYCLFHENLEKVLNTGESPPKTKLEAVKNNISLSRAAIGGLAAKGDLKSVNEIIDYFGLWSNFMIKAAQEATPRKQKETQDAQNYDILCSMTEENDRNIESMLKKITSSVCLVKGVVEEWDKFKKSGKWEKGVVVGDGGMGTELMKRGLSPTPSAWLNKTHKDEVLQIHKKHIEGGAQVVLSNTLDANTSVLSMYRKKQYIQAVKELNHIGVEIARNACKGKDVLVFGRMGPSRCDHKLYLSNGNRDEIEEKMREAFKEQAIELQKAGVDGIWIEGMTYIDEAVIAVKAVKENTQVPVICSMQFESAGKLGSIDFKTINWRNEISDVVDNLGNAGASMIGANCGDVVEEMPLLAQKMREHTDLPLVFRANAWHSREKAKYKTGEQRNPEEYAEIMSQVAAAGGNIVAGCCGTTQEHIASLRKHVA